MSGKKETIQEAALRSLRPLRDFCMSCQVCELGRKDAEKGGTIRDPHVLSNMNPSKYVVVGQNPGWDELGLGTPFVGVAGKNFDAALEKNGLSREDFYITNTIKCFTSKNAKPGYKHVSRCAPILQLELAVLRPKLVITLGAVAFGRLCPDADFSSSMRNIIKIKFCEHELKVFPIYHPSPLNLSDPSRREEFDAQIKLLCKIIKHLRRD